MTVVVVQHEFGLLLGCDSYPGNLFNSFRNNFHSFRNNAFAFSVCMCVCVHFIAFIISSSDEKKSFIYRNIYL